MEEPDKDSGVLEEEEFKAISPLQQEPRLHMRKLVRHAKA